MTTHKLLANLCFFALATNLGCSADKLNLPEPAELIVGTYQSLDNSGPLPLKGEKITMRIKRVTADLVEVNMQAYLNSQLVDSLVYEKASVIVNTTRTNASQGCVSPYIALVSPDHTDELSANCSERDIIIYSYNPPGQQTRINVRFKSL